MLLKSFLYVRAVALYYLSLEGLRAEPAFKFFDLMHEGWWRDAETQGGAGEMFISQRRREKLSSRGSMSLIR